MKTDSHADGGNNYTMLLADIYSSLQISKWLGLYTSVAICGPSQNWFIAMSTESLRLHFIDLFV